MLRKSCEFCAKDFDSWQEILFLMIIRLENFKEHRNQVSLLSEASLYVSDKLHTGCLKAFKA